MAEKPTYEALEREVRDLRKEISDLNLSIEDQQTKLEDRLKFEKDLRERIWKEVQEELIFEKFLSGVSETLANIPSRKIDQGIKDILRLTAVMFVFDRGSIMQYSEDFAEIHATHAWAKEGLPELFDFSVDRTFVSKDHVPWLTKKILRKEIVFFSDLDDLPSEAELDKRWFHKLGVNSGISIPHFVEGSFLFTLTFSSSLRKWARPEAVIHRLTRLCEIFSNAILRKNADKEMERALSEIRELKDRLQKENILLQSEISTISERHPEIIGESDSMKAVFAGIEQVAHRNTTVLILGETGTGKELIARAIHGNSERKSRPMVTVNCGALPPTLVEAELFGREKGAYTGALSKQVGRFEIANGSTIFLDEIGELQMELQVKLLRVLEQGMFERLGSSKTIRVDVRVIAATNRDLPKAIREGRFRQDLYYRLNVFPIQIPPLRDRADDILPLVRAFVSEFSVAMGKRFDTILKTSLDAMHRYSWPGNIRELRNVVERGMIVSTGSTLVFEIPKKTHSEATWDCTLVEVERKHILKVLEKVNWRIRGKNKAAEILGLNPGTLYSKMKKLRIMPPRSRS